MSNECRQGRETAADNTTRHLGNAKGIERLCQPIFVTDRFFPQVLGGPCSVWDLHLPDEIERIVVPSQVNVAFHQCWFLSKLDKANDARDACAVHI